ncbi:hypothetical protein DITRI_Ditri20bG0050100 [Diplodiscus trichospermus]
MPASPASIATSTELNSMEHGRRLHTVFPENRKNIELLKKFDLRNLALLGGKGGQILVAISLLALAFFSFATAFDSILLKTSLWLSRLPKLVAPYGGLIPPHSHPYTTEICVGFGFIITSNPYNRLITGVL